MDKEKRMTNANKLNSVQKTIMAEFMAKHPSLAQNLITNCAKGKAIADNLWATLTIELNDNGPPFKDGKTWKKVFADQKYQAKKKLSFNKTLKQNREGYYLYEQKRISIADQQILEASGLNLVNEGYATTKKPIQTHSTFRASSPAVCSESGTATIKVESNDSVDSFISLASTDPLDKDGVHSEFEVETPNKESTETHRSHEIQEDSIQSLEREVIFEEEETAHNVTIRHGENKRKPSLVESIEEVHFTNTNNNKKQKLELELEQGTTLKLLQENNSTQSEFQQRIETKLDRLLDIQERMLKIKEEKHKSVIALNLIKLQIKTMELDKLKAFQ